MKRDSAPQLSTVAILVCFFLSGAAGLIYQVSWVKSLGLIFGHTVYAVTTVLAVFMGGLAMGSAWFGGRAEREARPVALYARIEFLIAITGALSLAGLAGVRSLYVLTYPCVHEWPFIHVAIRFVGAALVLFIPTFLMGGTLPILVSAVRGSGRELGIRVSQLYWINTLGAAAGTLMSGFALLPALGLRLTIAIAAGLNVLAAGVARWVLRNSGSTLSAGKSEQGVTLAGAQLPAISSRFLLVLFAVVGATAFAYEIAWTRLLAITIGSSTYAFTLMLAIFLAGIVIGSALFQRFIANSSWIWLRTLAGAQVAIGICSVASLMLYERIPTLIAFLLRWTHGEFTGVLLAQFVACAIVMLPVATVFGINFPLAIALLGDEKEARSRGSVVVGKGYAANTAGAILGSLITGFWLVPRLGPFRTIAAAAVVNLLIAVLLDFKARPRRLPVLATEMGCVALALFVGLSPTFYNRSLLSFSAVLYSESQPHLSVQEIADSTDVVFLADGVNGSVAVTRTDNDVALRVNGKADASTGDARTQLLLGHLGAAFHPAPRRVLIIGFGSGMTVSAVARYPDVERIDCVEIEPAVMRAAPFFETLNHGVLNDPRVHMIFDDARNFLLTSREKYDLIISEPSNPWIAGVASLFTSEFYRGAQERLADGGIFVQWVQAYSLAPRDLRMVLATFGGRFPHVSMWRGEDLDFLLLGASEKLSFNFDRLRAFWVSKGLHDDFAALDVHEPEALIAYYLLDDSAVRKLAEGSVVNTDDRTLLEYHAPQTLLKHDLGNSNLKLVASFRSPLPPPEVGMSDVDRALENGVTTALDIGDTANADNFLNAPQFQRPSAARFLAMGRLALARGDLKRAESSLQNAAKLDPDSPIAAHWLAVTEHRLGNDTSAESLIDRVLAQHPEFLPALRDKTQFAVDRADFQAAMHTELEKMAVMDEPPASEYCSLGVILMKLTHVVAAEAALQKGLRKDPYSYACHLALSQLYLETAQLALARQNFEWLARFFPDSDASTFRSLAGVELMIGDVKSARAALRKGHRIFPDDTSLQKIHGSLGQ